jgi:lysozyme
MRRKKSRMLRLVLPAVIFLSAMSIAVYYFSLKNYEPDFIHYPGFGIDIPASYTIHGIDVSKYQRKVSWKHVREMKEDNISLGFVFMKATEGVLSVDEQFDRNWKQAGKEKLIRGAYHFFIPGKNPKVQAINFMQKVKLKAGDLPPVLDVEQAYGVKAPALRKDVKEWLRIVEQKYGVRPIIYTNVDFYKNYLAGEFDEYPLWVAHYFAKDRPRINREWLFWQHSEQGRVNGIESFVDFNVFSGDSLKFESIRIK